MCFLMSIFKHQHPAPRCPSQLWHIGGVSTVVCDWKCLHDCSVRCPARLEERGRRALVHFVPASGQPLVSFSLVVWHTYVRAAGEQGEEEKQQVGAA